MLRRLRIYFTGFAIGLVFVYFYFLRDDSRDLDIWMPEQRILEAIRNDSAFHESDALICYKQCIGLAQGTLDKLWVDGSVESLNPGGNPFRYRVSMNEFGVNIEAIVEMENEAHTLIEMKDINAPQTCSCED